MSTCTRLLVGRIVDGPSRDTIVNVLLDKVFDPTSPTAMMLMSAVGTGNSHSPEQIVKRTWQRARMELGYGFGVAAGAKHPPLAEWITLSRRSAGADDAAGVAFMFSEQQRGGAALAADAELGLASSSSEEALLDALRPPIAPGSGEDALEMVQLHATQNVSECIATVVIAIVGPHAPLTASASPAVFEAIVTGFPESIGGDVADPSDAVDNELAHGGGANGVLSHLLSSPPNMDGATNALVRSISAHAAATTLLNSIRAMLEPVMQGGVVVATVGDGAAAAAPVRDPWLALLYGGGGSDASPRFAALAPADVDRLEGTLRPMATQRLGFGAGSTWISRPLAFPMMLSAAASGGGAASEEDAFQQQQQAATNGGSALSFPAVFVVDVLSREVTENATVIRDCTEVWCDLGRVARLPALAAAASAVSKTGNKSNSSCGRRVGVVAMDWTFINSAAERAQKMDRAALVQNESFSAGVRMEESFGAPAAASAVAKSGGSIAAAAGIGSFYLSQTQKLAYDWSTLRRSHASVEDAAAAQSLPWAAAPPRAVGPALIRRPLVNEFCAVYEAALTRTAGILFGAHPSQLVAVRGLRALLFAVSPPALRSVAAPLAEAAAFADGEGHKNASLCVDLARAGARWILKRYTASPLANKKKFIEAQQGAIKSSAIFTAVAGAGGSGGGGFSSLFERAASGGAGASSTALLRHDPVVDVANGGGAPAAQARAQLQAMLRADGVPEFKRLARVASQQPRCVLSGQDDGTVGVKARLHVAPQILRPVVIMPQQQRKPTLLIECSFRFAVVFTSPTAFDAKSSAAGGGAGGGGVANGSFGPAAATALAQQQQPLRVMHESLAAFQRSDTSKLDSTGNEIAASGPPSAAADGGAGAIRKVCLERFRATIRGAALSPPTPPGTNPLQHGNGAAATSSSILASVPAGVAGSGSNSAVELKSSVPNALVTVTTSPAADASGSATTTTTTAAASSAASSGPLSSVDAEENSANACITWSLPAGTLLDIGQEISLTGRVLLETVWPDEQTAAFVAESVRTHAARPFAVPAMQAQLEFFAFADGDFGAADDVSLTGSHVDAFTATAIHSCVPDETEQVIRGGSRASNKDAFGGFDSGIGSSAASVLSQPQTAAATAARPVRWRNFSEALRAAIQQGAGAPGAQRDKVQSCLLAATSVDVDAEDAATAAAVAARVETLLPDWSTSCSSSHLTTAVGSQLGELSRSVLFGGGAGASTSNDYSGLVPAVPKARFVACGPTWGSNYVVWNT